MIAFADKVIEKKTADDMKGWLKMTKVGRLLEEEKRREIKKAVSQAKLEQERTIAKQMLADGKSREEIYRYTPHVAAEVLCESEAPYGKK